VANLLRNAAHNGVLRLFIAPNSIKVLSKRSAKSLSSINDDRYYRLKLKDLEQSSTSSSSNKYRSIPRLNGEQNNSNNQLSEPTEPLPRRETKKTKNFFFFHFKERFK